LVVLTALPFRINPLRWSDPERLENMEEIAGDIL